MQMPIELLSLGFLGLIFIFWVIYLQLSRLWLAYKYDPNNDKSRKGEEASRGNRATQDAARSAAKAVVSVPRPSKPAKRALLPPEPSGADGEDSSKLGKVESVIGSFLKRFRKEK